jgi:hypothetical protein
MTAPKKRRPGRDGHRATGRQGKTRTPIIARAAVLAEIARVRADPELSPIRRLAAEATLRRVLGASS